MPGNKSKYPLSLFAFLLTDFMTGHPSGIMTGHPSGISFRERRS